MGQSWVSVSLVLVYFDAGFGAQPFSVLFGPLPRGLELFDHSFQLARLELVGICSGSVVFGTGLYHPLENVSGLF